MATFQSGKRIFSVIGLTAILLVAMVAATGCGANGPNGAKMKATLLSKEVGDDEVAKLTLTDRYVSAVADFSFNLFKASRTTGANTLISPLSVQLALAMTANGADGQTLSQMEQVLGNGLSQTELNQYWAGYRERLPNDLKTKLRVANSIWFRDEANRLTVEPDFLKTNADYYLADVFKAAFDQQTLTDINTWVKNKTNGMIDSILEEISNDTEMYLINAVTFEGKWEKPYKKSDVSEGTFTTVDGGKQSAKFMYSNEKTYLDDGRATGFIKPYHSNGYSFVALLPNVDVPIDDYIESLDAEQFFKTLQQAEATNVNAVMPKFSYDYEVELNEPLKALGMPDAFSGTQANFTKLGKSTLGNLYIGDALHKTFIAVDELGTKAGAATKVEIVPESAMQARLVKLDRPFVYAIIDNETKLPVFLGTVMRLPD
jgi:serpin B